MSPPRIISGLFKGMRLNSVPGSVTRPITDRVKEALFNVIGPDIQGSSFLDLFAGTGSVGIEALSRGSNFVVFIEKNPLVFKVLGGNLERIKNSKNFSSKLADAFAFIEKECELKFDYIFIAPPQYKGMWKEMLIKVDDKIELMAPNTWVIVQIDPKEYEELDLLNLKEFDKRDYGSTRLVFFINP